MSNIGNQKIIVPNNVFLKINNDLGEIEIQGPLGGMKNTYPTSLELDFDTERSTLTVKSSKRSLRGTWRSTIQNLITGLSKGFQKTLKITGVGYRVLAEGNKLIFRLGFSHEVIYVVPSSISVICPKADTIVLVSPEKSKLNQIASEIRALRKPDPYKGKGIRFENEIIRLKEGKKK